MTATDVKEPDEPQPEVDVEAIESKEGAEEENVPVMDEDEFLDFLREREAT